MADQNYNVNVNIKETGGDKANQTIKDLNKNLKDTGKEAEGGFKKAMEGIKDKLGELSKEALPGAGAALEGLAVSLTNPIALAAELTVALGALGIALAFKFSEQIDKLADLGEILGIDANQVYFMKRALEDAGLSLQTFTMAGEKLSKAMSKSGDDVKGAGAAFNRLGVQTEDANGTLRSTSDVMDDLVKAYGEGELSARQVADMQLVLGKNFREAIVAYKEGQKAIEEYNEAIEAGVGITKESQDAAAAQEVSNRKLGQTMNAIGSIMVEIVIPAWTKLTDWFTKSYKEGGTVATVVNTIAVATKVLVSVLDVLIRALGIVIDSFIQVGEVGVNVMKGILQAATGNFKDAGDSFKEAFISAFTDKKGIGDRTLQLGKDIGSMIVDGVKYAVGNGGDFVADAQSRVKQQGQKRGPAKNIFGGSAGGQADAVKDQKDALDALIDSLNKQLRSQENVNKADQVSAELQDKKYAGYTKEQKAVAIAIGQKIDEAQANKLVGDAIRGMRKEADSYVNTLDKERKSLTMSKRDLEEYVEFQKLDQQTQEEINKLKEKNIWNLDAENKLLEANAEAKRRVIEATKDAKAADADWMTGALKSFQEYYDKISNTADLIKGVFDKVFTGIENMLVDFFTTGKLGFKDFAVNIIKELIRVQVQMTIMKPLMDWFKNSGGFSGIASGIGSFIGGFFADGGDPPTNKVSVVGERGPELFVPKGAGTIIPNDKIGGSSQGGNSYAIQVNIGSVDSEDRVAQITKGLNDTINVQIKKQLAEQQRRGNMLNR